MTNLEWLNENLTKEEKSNVQMCVVVNKKFYKYTCDGKNCYDCPLNKVGDLIDLLLKEHKEPIKLKQWEYDLLASFREFAGDHVNKLTLDNTIIISPMLIKGHFKGVTDTSMTIYEIIENCEVVDD